VVAPDFNTVRDRTAESLLVHLLDPNREVSPAYVVYSAVTADGRVATGIIAAETGSSITFRRAEAVEETVLRSRIDHLESSGLSLMPEGLEKDLSVDDVADLIAAVQGG
jgi:putative heme-binding domain-containing protein